jgi:hypothetical protein
LDWTQLIVVGLTVLAGLATWLLNERSKRRVEDYARRETRYASLIKSIRAFQVGSEDREAKLEFLSELDLCWLYGSDDVIRAAYALLRTMKDDVASTPVERSEAAGHLALAIREDLLRRAPLQRTSLKAADFELLQVK